MNVLTFLFRASPRSFIVAVTFCLVSGAAATVLIAQVNAALSSGPTATLALLFVLFSLLRVGSALLGEVQLLNLGHDSGRKLRLRISRAILDTPLRKLEELGPARLLAALTEDAMVLGRGSFQLAIMIAQVALVIGCGGYLGYLSTRTLLGTLLVLVGCLSVLYMMSARASRLYKLARDDQDLLHAGVRGITEGTKELKLHTRRRDAFLAEALDAPGTAYRQKQIQAGALSFFAGEWSTLLFLVLIGLLLFAAPQLGVSDSGVIGSYVLTLLYMQSSVEHLVGAYPDVMRASTALTKLDTLGFLLEESAEPTAETPSGPCKTVELVGVTHEYSGEAGDGRFVLGPIDLILKPGEIVFVTGGNGSGKSTLVKVLTGLYVPQSGLIRVDGELVTDATRGAYRGLYSVVFSDWFLFERLFGLDPAAVRDDAPTYLRELRLDKKVSVDDGVFSTTALSQGQRKRLMLLTAYLEDRPVYVFDEWASDQDPVFKEVFYAQILPRLKRRGKAVVVVSHDDRYFSTADRIVRLDTGRVAGVSTVAAGDRATSPVGLDA